MYKKESLFTDDGEVINHRLKKYSDLFDENGYVFRPKSFKLSQFMDIPITEVIKNEKDLLRIYILSGKIYKNTNMISYRISRRRMRPANVDDIAEIISLSSKRTKSFLLRMKSLNVIVSRVDSTNHVTTVKYYFNPLYFSSNNRLTPDLYFLFQSTLDNWLPEWVKIKFHEVGIIKSEGNMEEIETIERKLAADKDTKRIQKLMTDHKQKG